MERVKSCIPGLDELTGGGFPSNHLILVTGTSGTGKTVLGTQFAYYGVKKYKENGVYLSFEEPAEAIKENARGFGWDFAELEKAGKFRFIKYDPYHIEDVFDILESEIRNIKATRVVVDSISALGLHVRDDSELRRMIFNLSLTLRKLNCTSVIISEIVPGTHGLSRYGVEEFVSDGVIVLYYERIETTFARTLHVWKMRGSKHSEKLHPYKIDRSGITIYPEEEAFIKER
ncbi:MAG: AAA family ATPase [Candidatus Aenigmarchaeota archaeon]|nr:AAA family ATPase [Candidatus Aenigmarchaeota archaeon]